MSFMIPIFVTLVTNHTTFIYSAVITLGNFIALCVPIYPVLIILEQIDFYYVPLHIYAN